MAKSTKNDKRLKTILDFLREIEKLQQVKRVIYRQDGSQENTAEHTWHLAMFVLLLGREFDPKADLVKMLKMALIHDLVEVYAGDTPLFNNDKERETKSQREHDAATKLFAQLPADLEKELWSLFDEFEAATTSEAKIVDSLDHLQPIVHNLIHSGKSWKVMGLGALDHDKKKRPKMLHNNTLLALYETLHNEAKRRGLFTT